MMWVDQQVMPGQWYTDTFFSTCSSNTMFDTIIEVYTGNCSSGFTCIAENDDAEDASCPGGTSKLQLPVDPASDYFILVRSKSSNITANLTFEFLIDVVYNYFACPSFYQSLQLGEKLQYELTWYDSEVLYGCWDMYWSGTWYSLEVDTGSYTISVCCQQMACDINLWLVQDMCQDMVMPSCVRSTYYDELSQCDTTYGASFSFSAYSSATYWILVHTWSPPVTFTVSLQRNSDSGYGVVAIVMSALFAVSFVALVAVSVTFFVYVLKSRQERFHHLGTTSGIQQT
eukprot:TRINITY_DN879_c0_g1_i1.p1 TRINITY_DN879_c0_g1~~TRINITY_DN879_c0_g1_i1.p1  ORF type:complete len:286 (+),score=46.85 TRINITY_DN879_c0_g1_i1:439-1296(+)